ncbi:MAG: hypothetical protein ABMB14_08255, partial [Myxococcota bacterium]
MIGLLASCAARAAPQELEVAGGLAEALKVVSARYGVAATYEGTPLDREGVEWVAVPTAAGGTWNRPTTYGPLRFAVPARATGIDAVRAAVDAWNRRPDPEARYAVVEAPGFVHVVPVADADVDGVLRPYTPLLDTVIHLDRTTGTPTVLYAEIRQTLARVAGTPIHDLREGFALETEDCPPATVAADGTARDVLDQVVRSADSATRWGIEWSVEAGPYHGWSLWFDVIRPGDAAPSGRAGNSPSPRTSSGEAELCPPHPG